VRPIRGFNVVRVFAGLFRADGSRRRGAVFIRRPVVDV
jgi:hypothetical protein